MDNYTVKEITDILESNHIVTLYNGYNSLAGSSGVDTLCIRTGDLHNIVEDYALLGFKYFEWCEFNFLYKPDDKGLQDFARTPEMMEKFKNWKEWHYPPDLVRMFYMKRSSKRGRVFMHPELKKEIYSKNNRIETSFKDILNQVGKEQIKEWLNN